MKRAWKRRVSSVGVAATLVLAGGRPAVALTCDHARLKGASGVIGQKHTYSVTAKCHEEHSSSSTQLTWSGLETTSVNTGFAMSVVGKASWDRKTGEARENLAFTGDVAGERIATGVCDQDPFLSHPPGDPAICHGVQSQYKATAGPLFAVLVQQRFFLARTLDLAEAQALSQQAAAAPPPPAPPPPAPKPKAHPSLKSPSGTRVWEAEERLTAGKLQVAGGKAAVQPMQGFGSEWSGNAQLFWAGGQVGAVLDLEVDILEAGRYQVRAEFTKAPDFGLLRTEVAGQPSALTFDAYSPQVLHSEPVELGIFQLAPGPCRISFQIVGKHPQSSGFFAGIDRVLITPVKQP